MSTQVSVNAYFDNIDHHIKNELRSAREKIYICVAWINFQSYQEILFKKILEGLDVKILCNGDFINHKNLSNLHPSLLNRISLIKNPIPRTLIHHKFCIIDDSTLINGSHNWSNAAFYHYENITIIKNDYVTINRYKHEFYDLLQLISETKYAHFPKINKNTSEFILGMISEPYGDYGICNLQNWRVDLNSRICNRLNGQHMPNFYDIISTGIDDDGYQDYGYVKSKEDYQEEFNQTRKQMNLIKTFFNENRLNVHAIGRAVKNQEHKYDEEESSIEIIWVDVYYRKVVPDSITPYGDFETVFNEAYFAGR